MNDQQVEFFLNDRFKRSRRKFSAGDYMSKNNRLAMRGEKKVSEMLGLAGLLSERGLHNDRFDMLAVHPAGELKIEVKTARYSNGFYKFSIRQSTADFIVLACCDRRWWYLVIPGDRLSGVVGFSIRARNPEDYTGRFKDTIGRFDLIEQRIRQCYPSH